MAVFGTRIALTLSGSRKDSICCTVSFLTTLFPMRWKLLWSFTHQCQVYHIFFFTNANIETSSPTRPCIILFSRRGISSFHIGWRPFAWRFPRMTCRNWKYFCGKWLLFFRITIFHNEKLVLVFFMDHISYIYPWWWLTKKKFAKTSNWATFGFLV